MSNPFSIGSQYNFATLAPSILGAEHNNVTVKAVFDYEVALTFLAPDIKHASIFPLLPSGTIDDPKKYTYVLFKSQSGADFVMALEWIDLNTVVQVVSVTLNVTLNNCKPGDAAVLRDTLLMAGFVNFTIA